MQIFKMLFNNNVKRIVRLSHHSMYSPFVNVQDKIVNVLYNVFTSNKNCMISIKDYRQSGETTNLLAYAGVYCQTHYNKTVFYVVDNNIMTQLLSTYMCGENILFVTSRQFDIAIRGRADIGLVIVDSQVTNVSKIIEYSKVIKNTQFVISTDETNIRYI